ncbi:MAG: HNH endonuclease [Deltaproteobacteria bacterium]|nr:HNH endonuclease [Deltaproteobacteria bacterium]
MANIIPSTKLLCVSGFPDYAITKDGRVWSYPKRRSSTTGRWLKSNKTSNDYFQVVLCKNKKKFPQSVHRLVLETYIGKCPKNMVCRHLDGNKANNHLDNLCWGTRHENEQDKIKHGTVRRGENHNDAKLTEQDVRLIYGVYWDGAYELDELAKHFSVNTGTIHDVVHKRTWKHLWV